MYFPGAKPVYCNDHLEKTNVQAETRKPWKRRPTRGVTFTDAKTYYKIYIIKTVWYWCINRNNAT